MCVTKSLKSCKCRWVRRCWKGADACSSCNSQRWCKMCVESRARESPHREQSKIDAVVSQLQCDYGYMGDAGPLQIACFQVGADTSSGAIHATMVPDSKKVDMPYVVAATAKWVRDLRYERFCLPEGVLQFPLGKVAKECRLEGQGWQILRQVSPTQSHQSSGAAEKAVSTVRGLATTYLAVLKDKIPSFEVTTHSPMFPWTIRHAAWILTRYNVRGDTRMTRTRRFVDRNTGKRSCHWVSKFSLAVQEQMSTSFCSQM